MKINKEESDNTNQIATNHTKSATDDLANSPSAQATIKSASTPRKPDITAGDTDQTPKKITSTNQIKSIHMKVMEQNNDATKSDRALSDTEQPFNSDSKKNTRVKHTQSDSDQTSDLAPTRKSSSTASQTSLRIKAMINNAASSSVKSSDESFTTAPEEQPALDKPITISDDNTPSLKSPMKTKSDMEPNIRQISKESLNQPSPPVKKLGVYRVRTEASIGTNSDTKTASSSTATASSASASFDEEGESLLESFLKDHGNDNITYNEIFERRRFPMQFPHFVSDEARLRNCSRDIQVWRRVQICKTYISPII